MRSKIPAAPIPPPMHMVTSPYRARRRPSSPINVASNFAPVQPRGCPSAIAPPFGLMRAGSSPASWITPVSYTHLDVYKRQHLSQIGNQPRGSRHARRRFRSVGRQAARQSLLRPEPLRVHSFRLWSFRFHHIRCTQLAKCSNSIRAVSCCSGDSTAARSKAVRMDHGNNSVSGKNHSNFRKRKVWI